MNERSIEPLDVVAVGIHNHDLIAKDGHRQQKNRSQRHCEGERT